MLRLLGTDSTLKSKVTTLWLKSLNIAVSALITLPNAQRKRVPYCFCSGVYPGYGSLQSFRTPPGLSNVLLAWQYCGESP